VADVPNGLSLTKMFEVFDWVEILQCREFSILVEGGELLDFLVSY
jgi:hypothetical protein